MNSEILIRYFLVNSLSINKFNNSIRLIFQDYLDLLLNHYSFKISGIQATFVDITGLFKAIASKTLTGTSEMTILNGKQTISAD